MYRPPPSKKNNFTDSMFFDQFSDFLEHSDSLPGKTLLMGDFNFHFENLENNSRKLHDIIDIFNLTQSVTEPTHNQGHLLDLVLSKQSDNILLSTKLHHGLTSDHTAILCKLDVSVPLQEPETFQYRCLKKIDTNTFKQDLSDVISRSSSVSDYNNHLRSVLDKHAPLCRRTSRTRKPTPWFSSIAEQFCELKRERRKAERRWLKSKLTVHKQIYDSIKQKVTDLVDKAKRTYFSAKIQSSTTCKQLFQNFNSMLGKNFSSPLPSAFDSDDLPTVFSEYFTEKIRTIRNNFPPPNPTVSSVASFTGDPLQTFDPVTDDFVLKIIKSTPAKSCELDPIPTTLLYDNLDILLPTITNIINTSLTTGIVPRGLKTAIVKPLLKKPSLDKNLLKNYRPISNLPFLSKILEKVVLHKLLSHLQANNLCNPFQSAYRAGHSTETALLRVINDILSALDNDNISVLLLLDLSAAFDTIDHQILLSRLYSLFGIQSTALEWFESYLSDRCQFTSVNNSSSPQSQLKYGVPQGSVLGPVLFVLYTTPLSDIIASHSVNHQLFADDTQLQKSAPLSEIDNLTKELCACTDDIKAWMTENQLKLNDDKTEALLFSFFSSSKPAAISLPDSITLGCHNIPFSYSARNLGFILDSELSMKKHVIKICQTAHFELKRISSIRRFLTEDATKTLVTSYILSRLDYCNCLLMGAPNSVIQPLQKVQNFAARLILMAPRHHHSTPLLKKLHWLPISERIKYKVACMCFHAINGSGPTYLSELLHIYTPSRTLRSSSDSRMLKIQQYKRKTHGFRTFTYFGPYVWNSLPQDIRQCSTLTSFKANLKTFLFSQYFHSS
ncbi:reverse transcriptase family protein [Thiolapillus sp.]|uniref:reverse transcriptase family protein n=1 Tax=Thiolapillus sp. TaxID=2017437 RepID=UPI003AF6CFE3